jgi:hypothetical protein
MRDDDDRFLADALARATAQIRWRGLAMPLALDGGPHDGCTVTHEGVLELPGVGCVKAYRLSTGEAVFAAEEVRRLLGLEEGGEDHE